MARNKRYLKGERLYLPVPNPADTVSGSPVMVGNRGGVALTDPDANNSATVDLKGVFMLNVNGTVNNVGEAVYYADVPDPNDRITRTSTANQFFGYALQTGNDEELPVLIGEASGISDIAVGAIETEMLEDDALSADVTGRDKMADGYFNAATIADKFGADSLDDTNIGSIVEDGAIGSAKLEDFAEEAVHAARVVKATWNAATEGGVDKHGTGITLPEGAIVLGGIINCRENFDSATDNATLRVGIENEATDCNDLLAALTADGSLDVGMYDVIPEYTAATAVLTTAPRELTVEIREEAGTTGIIDIFIYYVQSE